MVFDRQSGDARPSTPDSEAYIRDFYTVERADRGDAYIAEEALRQLETIFDPVIARVNETRGLPSNIRPLLGFIAMQFLRTPSARAWFAQGHNAIWMAIIEQDVRHRDAFLARARKAMPDATPADLEDLYEGACELLRAGRVEMDQTTLIRNVFDLAPDLEDVLAERCWLLGITPDDAPAITSDDPIVLEWSGSGEQPESWHPGLEDPDTVVLVALGPHHILAGVSEQVAGKRRKRLTRKQVAQFNATVACRAARFVYYSGAGFPFDCDGEVLVGPTEWLKGDENDPGAGKKRGVFRVEKR